MFIQDAASLITVRIFLVININENTGLDSGSQLRVGWGLPCPPPLRDICQYLETFVVVTSWVTVLLNLLCRVQLLFHCSVMSDPLWPHGLQHARLPCPSLSPGVCSNSCPLSQWCHPTISSSTTRFSEILLNILQYKKQSSITRKYLTQIFNNA